VIYRKHVKDAFKILTVKTEGVKSLMRPRYIYIYDNNIVMGLKERGCENFFLKPHFISELYIYIQQIGVSIGCYGLGRGTQ
jgi:hypothetical protein